MRRFAVLLVVGLVLLAGCNGLVGDPTTDGPDGSDGAGTTDGGTATDGTTDGSDGEYPPGYTDRGPESLGVALENHYSSLRPHSYTAEFLSDQGTEVSGTVRVDGETQTGSATFFQEGAPTQDLYLEDETRYHRVNRPGNVTYAAVNSTYDDFRFQLTAPTLQWITHVRWNHVGTAESNGRTVHRYRTVGINDSKKAAPNPGAVSNLDGTLVVDEQGAIHEFSLSADVEEVGKIRYRYTLSELDSTEFEEPEWLPTAREETG